MNYMNVKLVEIMFSSVFRITGDILGLIKKLIEETAKTLQ